MASTPVPEPTPVRSEIPAWVKSNAAWWADGLITEDDFIKEIKFLIKNQIMTVN
jgi:hypothetical protein